MPDAALTGDEVRRTQLGALRQLHDFCAEQGLTYMLTYGSLLGAVRHQGFIPWDDDVDVMMPRADYEMLRQHRSIGGFDVAGGVTDRDWPVPYLKISDPSTVVTGGGAFEPDVGVNIDVFPIDGVPAGARRVVQRPRIGVATRLLSWQAIVDRPERSGARRLAVAAARPALDALPRARLLRQLGRASARDELGSQAGVLVGSYQWSVPTTALLPVTQAVFEGLPRNVPAEPHVVLRRMYGDHYLSPPPLHARRSHHVFTAHRR